jgi:predicted metalloprotease with PDZ domain
MQTRALQRRSPAALLLALSLVDSCARTQGTIAQNGAAQRATLEPLRYTVRLPAPATKTFDVDVVVPTERRDSIVVMMPVWSPGMYTLQSYGDRVTAFAAREADGTTLQVTKTPPSRWIIRTRGAPSVTVSYTVAAPRGGNLSNGVTDTSLVIVGPATYIARAEPEQQHRPAEVRLELPPGWRPAQTSLDAAPDGAPNHFVAPNYDVLADSPILAGTHVSTTDFIVGGVTHRWVYLGDAEWSASRTAEWVKPLIEEHRRFWGSLPFKRYVFLNIVGAVPGSGVEHLNSVAINTSGREPMTPDTRFRQASFISHEYFHAMNVKRLRPVELGPFDYEHTPVTTGLWVAEGLTSYFGDLLAARSGLGSAQDYLALTSKHISDLQNSPGRLVQTLQQASAQMFQRIPAAERIDYYVKGPVVGLILDAHIRKETNGRKSMDDVIRLEYARWSGARGYTAEQFAQTASDAVGLDIRPLLHKLVATTEEIDYSEMLDWFGLRFVPNADPTKAWSLEMRPDATSAQRAHFAAFLAPSTAP